MKASRGIISLLATVTFGGAVLAAQPTASGSWWIDAKVLLPWNVPGGSVPRAPLVPAESLATGRCADLARRPAGAEDQAVVAAGWTPVGPLQLFSGVAVVSAASAASAADDLCRPLRYQVFVFVDGQFVGTLAPVPADARTDGFITRVSLVSRDRIVAEIARYGPDDPLCCPSRTSTVTYAFRQGTAGTLVVAVSAVTQMTKQ